DVLRRIAGDRLREPGQHDGGSARALIVSRTGSKPPGCRAAASCQPPMSNTGAHPEDSTAHQGTRSLRMGSLAQHHHVAATDRVALTVQITVHPDLSAVG